MSAKCKIMDIFEALYRRRAIRHFKLPMEPIPDEVIERVLDAARFAPSAENQQPWRIILIKDEESKKFLGDLAEEVAKKQFGETRYEEFDERLWYIDNVGLRPRVIEPMMTGEEERFPEHAYVDLLMCFPEMYSEYVHHANTEAHAMLALWSLCMAIQNMWLTITALGGREQKYGIAIQVLMVALHGRYMLRQYFGIPDNFTPIGVVCIGVPRFRRLFGPGRFPHEGVAYDDYWGVPYKRLVFRSNGSEATGQVPSMDTLECIYTRRSIRRFNPDPIPEWKVEQILDAGRWAPSGENLQTWRFMVIRDEETKKILGDIGQEQSQINFGTYPYRILDDRLWYIEEEKRPRVVEPLLNGSLESFCEQAPITIMVLRGRTWHESAYNLSEWSEIHSRLMIPFPVQNMLLAAHALGLGSVPATLPLADRRRIDRLVDHLGIPHWWDPAFVLPIGIPKEPKYFGPPRFPLEGLVYDEYWGIPYKRLAFR